FGPFSGLEPADQLYLEPAYVRANGPAENGRRATSSVLRQFYPAPVADVDGFRRPAGQRGRTRPDLHVRRHLRGPSDHGRPGRLCRPLLDPAFVPRHPAHTPT